MNSNKLFSRKRLVFEKVLVEKIFFKHYFLEKKKKKKPYPPKWAALVIAAAAAEVVVLLHRLDSVDSSPAIRWDRKRRSDRREISTTPKIGISSLRWLKYHSLSLSVNPCMQFLFFVFVFLLKFVVIFFFFLDEKYMGEIVCEIY